MDKLVAGIGNAVGVAVIFFGSMIMAALSQTYAENLYPELKDKRDVLFWVWLAIWLVICTVVWTAVKGVLDI